MPLWGWLMMGWIGVSVAAGLCLARLLGRVTQSETTVSEYVDLLEFKRWLDAPLMREAAQRADDGTRIHGLLHGKKTPV